MGIALSSLTGLFIEMKRMPFSGSLLQIGRQDIYFDVNSLTHYSRIFGVNLAHVDHVGYRYNQWKPHVHTLDDITFFKLLGLDSVDSVDTNNYENPTFIHDFNFPVGEEHYQKYDIIYDGGSLEHIFNTPCALMNITKMLKVGGRVIHETPLHNFIDHGFYQFCPGFFYDYYEANHFKNIKVCISGLESPLTHERAPKIFNYIPGQLENISVGGFNKSIFQGCDILANFVVAEKSESSTGESIPVQRRYKEWWVDGKYNNK
jgi:hypothetical protein